MKKVLIITYYWPPMGGGGVQRWLKMTKYFRENGWEPVIFTTEGAEISIHDESLLKEVPEGIEVIKVPIWEPFNVYKKLLGKKKNEKINPGFLQESNSNSRLQKLAIWVRGNMFIPDAKKYWIKPASKALNKYLKANPVDAIVSTGPPHTNHLIAQKALNGFSIPWVVDFRDPWTNIDFYDQLMLSNWADKKHKRLEQSVLKQATEVVTVSWSWANDFERLSGRKIKVITNGYDPADFTDQKVSLDEKFTFTHVGSMNADRHPKQFIEALAEVIQENKEIAKHLVLKFIGPVDIQIMNHLKERNLFQYVEHIPSLPHQKVIAHIQSAQVLLLPLNDVPNIDGVLPGKLYEYLGAKRPIFCIGKLTGDAGKIIQETNAGVINGFEDKIGMKNVIMGMFRSYMQHDLVVNSDKIAKFSRQELAKSYCEMLSGITG